MAQVSHSAHRFQLVVAAQFPGQSYLVNGLIALEQRNAGCEANLVLLSVEVLGFDHMANSKDGVPVNQ